MGSSMQDQYVWSRWTRPAPFKSDTFTTRSALSPSLPPAGRRAAAATTAGCTSIKTPASIPPLVYTVGGSAITPLLLAAGSKTTRSVSVAATRIFTAMSAMIRRLLTTPPGCPWWTKTATFTIRAPSTLRVSPGTGPVGTRYSAPATFSVPSSVPVLCHPDRLGAFSGMMGSRLEFTTYRGGLS